MTAICTPIKTRAEFESILRELDGVGVTWRGSGNIPSTRNSYWSDGDYLVYNFNDDQALLIGLGMEDRIPVLPRAEFIAAIKRDFGKPDISKMETTGVGPKIDCSYPTEIKEEQPKMKIYTDITPDALVIISKSLEEKSTVKWCGGERPTATVRLGLNKCLAFNYGNSGSLSHGLSKTYAGSLEKVTNKEFVDRIVRELPKEKPKMNYKKMTKAELIAKIISEMEIKEKNLVMYLELKAKWTEQNRQLNEALNDRDTMRGIANDMTHRCTELEKTNAEQAETIRSLECSIVNARHNNEYLESNIAGERRALKKITTKFEKQTASISKFFADVLEGKIR